MKRDDKEEISISNKRENYVEHKIIAILRLTSLSIFYWENLRKSVDIQTAQVNIYLCIMLV